MFKLLIFLLFGVNFCFGQTGVNSIYGAKYDALGGAVTATTGIQSIISNPTGLAWNNSFGAIVSSEQRYLLNELTSISLGLSNGFGDFGVVGISAVSFGFEEYREQQIAINYSRLLTANFAISGTGKYYLFNLAEYGQTSILGVELGMQSKINNKVMLGFHIANPVARKLGLNTELETNFSLGVAYQPTTKASLSFDVKKSLRYDPSFHLGVDYRIKPNFSIRFGGQVNPSSFSLGIAYSIDKKIHFDGSFRNHQHLGQSPSLSIAYFGEK